MGDLSRSFNRKEFKCKCNNCCRDQIDHELIVVLEWLDNKICSLIFYDEIYIVIKSGNRCPLHNFNENGSHLSKHMYYIACDFKIFITRTGKQVPPTLIYKILDLEFPKKYGLGLYHNRNHLDIRKKKARWDRTLKTST